MSLLNKILPPPLTNPFFATPGQALDAVTAPIRETYGIPGSYQYVEQALKKALGLNKAVAKPTVRNLPPEYKQSELAAGAAAEAFREGAGFPGQQVTETFASVATPSERAYLEEKRRATQLAEQDPLAKKYRVADLTKAYNAAKGEEKERLGLEIWATTNPQLAQKLRPGQTGYTEATSAFMSSNPLGSYVKSVGDMQFADKVSLPTEPVAGAFNITTPLTGIEIPEGVKQVGVAEKFANISPATAQAMQASFTEPLKLFKPDLTQTQQALLRQAFERGLK